MRRWLLHLGSITSASGWNYMLIGASSLANLKDDASVVTDVGVTLSPAIVTTNANGTNSSTRYPADVTNTSVYTSSDANNGSPPQYTLTLTGLDPSKVYDLIFYASRAGVAEVRTGRYTVGATSVVLDAANNLDNVVSITEVAPDGSGNIVMSWQGDIATNTSASRFGYLSVLELIEGEASEMELESGIASFVSASGSAVSLTSTSASGGSGSYTYQWHRSATGGFAPGGGTVLTGATSLTLSDTTAVAGVLYFYKLVTSDGTDSVIGNQVMGALNVPTTPLAIDQQATLILGYIGSSTWAGNTGIGTVPELIEQELLDLNPAADITTINGAVGGSASAQWVPGQTNFDTLKTTMLAAGSGFKILRLMIGSNDAAGGQSTATWQANVQAIIDDAESWVDLIIVEEIGIRLDGGDAVINRIVEYNAARSSLTGTNVLLGTAHTLANQATHLSQLSGDDVHQTQEGSVYLAEEQAAELSLAVSPMEPVAPSINGRLVVRPNSQAGTITISSVSAAGSAEPTEFVFDGSQALHTFLIGSGIAGGAGGPRFGLDL